eukprot:CAMPEP_0116993954 /NCGR_PEP_ID=MMETSP0467-20121206/67804_1 /TAXON_ID=283647 /ORGANISM="Mesodinium pulex, Strain SPMC105" /LENGTH=55 /DNA_ID=CAMNT_0004691853 /DNA_START=13 /DNA_END=178 /DNA_ORIENTATION=+
MSPSCRLNNCPEIGQMARLYGASTSQLGPNARTLALQATYVGFREKDQPLAAAAG